MTAVVRGRSVDAKPDARVGVDHAAYRRDARRQTHVRAGAMADTRARATEQIAFIIVELDAVSVPDIRPDPAGILRVFARSLPEHFQTVSYVVVVLSQMRVQMHVITARQRRRFTHQILADSERRAR